MKLKRHIKNHSLAHTVKQFKIKNKSIFLINNLQPVENTSLSGYGAKRDAASADSGEAGTSAIGYPVNQRLQRSRPPHANSQSVTPTLPTSFQLPAISIAQTDQLW